MSCNPHPYTQICFQLSIISCCHQQKKSHTYTKIGKHILIHRRSILRICKNLMSIIKSDSTQNMWLPDPFLFCHHPWQVTWISYMLLCHIFSKQGNLKRRKGSLSMLINTKLLSQAKIIIVKPPLHFDKFLLFPSNLHESMCNIIIRPKGLTCESCLQIWWPKVDLEKLLNEYYQ